MPNHDTTVRTELVAAGFGESAIGELLELLHLTGSELLHDVQLACETVEPT